MSQSYAIGSSESALIEEPIHRVFERTLQQHSDRLALVSRAQGIRWSYGQLAQRVDDLAAGLLSIGLVPGDRLGICAPNCAEWLLTQLATAKAGVILVNINPAYRTFELEYALNKVGCKALVLAPSLKSSDYIRMMCELAPELETSVPGAQGAQRLPELRAVIRLGLDRTAGMFSFWDVVEAGQRRASGLSVRDPINIQFTSGTTGSPKGATLTHRNILNNGFFVGEAIGLTSDDRVCIPVPLYHCFGMVMGNLACNTHGAAMVYPAPTFEPLATLEAVAAERCTALYGVPTMFIAELDHPECARFDLTSLRTGIMAGAPCPIEVMKRVNSVMNMREVTIAYGMTETSPVSTQTSRDDPLEKRVSTVGRVHPRVEIRIVDGNGDVLPRGQPGEFCTRGYSVMSGYWNDAERTAEAIDTDGWMHTGDLAVMDDDGYVNIVGRLKDMIIRGGENVYPREIEEFLHRHPKVQDVQVLGVPDSKYGEEICAWVRLRSGEESTEDAIRAFCRENMAHYKVPRYVRFVEEFPMTITGKAQKYLMRRVMIEELKLRLDQTA
ncbi:MAG: AMP-binding protein [Proteobacteria bacterium]|nr:AMP-binding protein [Pseudomonadota bacterium]